jgi:hypothetical protein
MQRLRTWTALVLCFLASAGLARAQMVLFDDTFLEDPLMNNWLFNGVAQWVQPPDVAEDCHDGLHDPNNPGIPPCSVYNEKQVENLGETIEEFGGYILVTPGQNGQAGNAFRSERAMYDNFKMEVVVELRDGSIGRPADGMVVVIVGGDEPPNRTGTGGGGMGAPCVGITNDQPMLAFEFDNWSCNTGDNNDQNHVAFSYSPNGFPCSDAIPPQVFVPLPEATVDLHNQEAPPATPNRYRMTVFGQRCGAGGLTVACNLEAIDRGIDLGRVYTRVVPNFVPFEGWLGVTASTGNANQNHILHSARLETLPDGFCLQPAAGANRSISGTRNVVDNCGDFLPGDVLTATLTLENVRDMSDCCSAAGSITVRDAPPAGWAVVPGSITSGGMVVGNEVVWTVMSPSEGQTLSYRVTAADTPGTTIPWGNGSVVENVPSSASVLITGQSQVTRDSPFDDCGGIKCWNIVGALQQPGGAAPGAAEILEDYLTDGVTSDVVFRMAPGDEINPDINGAASSTGIFNDPNNRNPNRANGTVTTFAWNDTDSYINLNDDVFQGDPNNTMNYAAVRVISEDELADIHLEVLSDDSIRVVLNGQEVHSNNIPRGAGLCGWQDTMILVTLEAGVNDLRVSTFEGGGGWNFGVRFVDPSTGTPITEGLSISKTADIGCRRPPANITRTVATGQTIRVGPRVKPSFSQAGETYDVTLTGASPRTAGDGCAAAGMITITETVPAGWTPSMPSGNGMINGQQITWTIPATSLNEYCRYRVTTGGAAVNAQFGGSVRDAGGGGAGLEPSAFSFGFRGDREVVYVPDPFGRDVGDLAVDDDFNVGAEESCPDNWTCNATGGPPLAPFIAGITQQAGHAGRLRLANQNGNIASSVIYNDPFDLSSNSFIAEFDVYFNHTVPTATPADGITFCVLNADAAGTSPTSLGAAGGCIGYCGLNGFAVEFDLWDNGPGPTGYNNAQNPFGHVALIRDGTILPHVQTHLDLDPNLRPRRLGGSGFPFFVDFTGPGVPLHCEVDYNNGHIQAFLTAPATLGGAEGPFARTKVLDTVILFNAPGGGAGLEPGLEPLQNVFFGFTAGTGGAFAFHEVDNFRLTIFPDVEKPKGPLFVRGDADRNGTIELTDAVRILNFLFLGIGSLLCEDAADVDDNGRHELTDAVRDLNYLFLGTGMIPEPTPSTANYVPADCGLDPTDTDPFGCGSPSIDCGGV